MNTFVKRTLSATVYAAVVVTSILLNRYYFGAVFMTITLLAIREWAHLLHADRRLTVWSMIAGGALFGFGFLFLDMVKSRSVHSDVAAAGSAICLLFFVISLLVLLVGELFRHSENPVRNWGITLQTIVMVALPLTMMNGIMLIDPRWLLMVFIAIWVNDSGAYIVGVLTAKRPRGNHKMAPHISPLKSWEGLAGGYFFTLLCAYVFLRLSWIHTSLHPDWLVALIFGLTVSTAATLGDLMESLLKRHVGVKDSGRFMPGHGGVLDRFDSILLTVPVWAIILLIVSI